MHRDLKPENFVFKYKTSDDGAHGQAARCIGHGSFGALPYAGWMARRTFPTESNRSVDVSLAAQHEVCRIGTSLPQR
jgi:hypothetical protein